MLGIGLRIVLIWGAILFGLWALAGSGPERPQPGIPGRSPIRVIHTPAIPADTWMAHRPKEM